jgi:hypothetical protein
MTGFFENYFLGSEFNVDTMFLGASTIKKNTGKLQFSICHAPHSTPSGREANEEYDAGGRSNSEF